MERLTLSCLLRGMDEEGGGERKVVVWKEAEMEWLTGLIVSQSQAMVME